MSARLQLDTILHNYIDNRNHYLYHFRPLRMKLLPSLPLGQTDIGRPATSTRKQREHVADRATGRQRVSSTFLFVWLYTSWRFGMFRLNPFYPGGIVCVRRINWRFRLSPM